jgi:hypothetical protein
MHGCDRGKGRERSKIRGTGAINSKAGGSHRQATWQHPGRCRVESMKVQGGVWQISGDPGGSPQSDRARHAGENTKGLGLKNEGG